MNMFELVSAVVRYFASIKERSPHRLSISPAFASSGCDIDPIVNDFRRYALSSG